MSNIQPWQQAIAVAERHFDNSALDYIQERVFATQQLMSNKYLLDTAIANPDSLKLAIFNLAAIGLSLNPAQGLAYLVPRYTNKQKRVLLDISYKGLVDLAVKTGTIVWAKPELVYENDQFEFRGMSEKPLHRFNPFATDRGEVVGGYCIAEMPSGHLLVDAMSKADMDKIRDSSEAAKKGAGPWVQWEDQMQLKSVIKRASKWWPRSAPQFVKAVQMLNEENGEGLAVVAEQREAEKIANGELPPPTAEDISSTTVTMVKMVIDRAIKAGAYESCRSYFEDRISSPVEKAYAMAELEKAEAANGFNQAAEA